MKVLLTGANGFIASAIIERLQTNDWSIIATARSHRYWPANDAIEHHSVDFRHYREPDDWRSLLMNVDVVINCAGILREQQRGDFDLIHYAVPKALLSACMAADVRKFIQLSAIGYPEDGAFIRSKHKFDDDLLATAANSTLSAVVIRPSVVVSVRGSYGGTSLLRALAAMPLVLLIPGAGRQRIQPVLLEDLATIVVNSVCSPATGSQTLYAAGPEILTMEQYLILLRSWLKLPAARTIHLPDTLISVAAWFGQHFSDGPLGLTMKNMLERGNTAPPGAVDALVEQTAFKPRSVSETLLKSTSFVQDRWHARLSLLSPIIWGVLIVIWLVSGIAGLTATPAEYRPLLDQLSVPITLQPPLVIVTSGLDIVLGLALLFRYKVRPVLWLMLLAVLAYTLIIGFLAPLMWLEPLGSLLKNIAIAALLLSYLVLVDTR